MAITVSLEGILFDKVQKDMILQHIEKICEAKAHPFEMNQHEGQIYICPEGIVHIELQHDYLKLWTQTSLVGPGYHAYICELFQEIQDNPVVLILDDECEYLEDHDFQRIKDQYFYPYLYTLLSNMKAADEGCEATYAWDDKHYLPLSRNNCVITPLGAFNLRELTSHSLQQVAQRMFIWNELEKDGRFYLNCALVMLWCECRFEASHSDQDYRINQLICDCLEQAYALDPTLTFPLVQYMELCHLLKRPMLIQDVKQNEEEIGYRLESVLYPYGNWMIYEAGSCQQEIDDNTLKLHYYDPKTHEWLSTMRINGYISDERIKSFATSFVSHPQSVDEFEWEDEGIQLKGCIYRLNDETNTTMIQAQAIYDNEMLMLMIECVDASQIERILENLHYLLYLEPISRGADIFDFNL